MHDNAVAQAQEVLFKPIVFGNLLYLALVASMLCFVAWNWVLHNLGIVRATNIIYSQAVFTMIISYLILHEHITLMAISGTFILEEGVNLFGCIATVISIHNLYNTIAIMSIVNKKSVVLFACFKNKA